MHAKPGQTLIQGMYPPELFRSSEACGAGLAGGVEFWEDSLDDGAGVTVC